MLATALALLGFSVVSAILLMRTRVRARARRGAAARRYRGAAGPGRPLPRAAVRGTADPDLVGGGRQSPANHRRHRAADAAGVARRSACSPSEPGCRRNRRCRWIMRSTRCARPARVFCSISRPRTDTRSRPWAAPSAARPLSGFANSAACAGNWPKPTCGYKTLLEETEMLRGFAAAAPWPIWAKERTRRASLRQCRLCEGDRGHAASRTRSIATSNCSTATDRDDMDRALNGNSAFTARLPIVVGGERRIYDVHALNVGGGSAGIAIDASEASGAARGAGADGGGAPPHARSAVVRRRGVRRPAAAGLLQRFLSPAVGPRPRLSRRQSRRFQRARPAARRAQTARAAGFPGLEGQAARGLSRGRARPRIPGTCPTAARSASSPRPIRKAASPICSTTSPKASIWRGASTA